MNLVEGHQFVFNAGAYEDDLNDQTLSYTAYTSSAQWNIDLNHLFVDKLSPSLFYERRQHTEAEFGRNKRKDSKFIYGLQAQKALTEHQNLSMNFYYTNNQSSRRINRFKRTQVSLGYQINF